MNKNFIYAMLSAIALTGAVGFSSCSSSNDEIVDNPNFDPESNKVKTEFVINVTQPSERVNTRMTSDNAGNGAFKINNMNLICFTNVPASRDNSFVPADKFALTSYTGPEIAGTITEETDNRYTNTSSKVYTLYLPTGTTNFLFYATAIANRTEENNTAADKFAKGSLINNLDAATTLSVLSSPVDASDIKFNLEDIVSDDDSNPETVPAVLTTPQGYLTTILNDIKSAAISDLANIPEEVAADDRTKTWVSTQSAEDSKTEWRALRDAFKQFTNQVRDNSHDVRQGSSDAVLNMVNDLFSSVNFVYTSEENVTVKTLAQAVLEKICLYFTVQKSGTAPNNTYAWPNPGSYLAETNGATFNSNKYPETQYLPAGSAVLVYGASEGFKFVNNGTMGAATISTAYNYYTYPSQLTYYCNSALWQTATSKNTTDYPTTSTDWITASNWTGWDHNAVGPTTRAVAMEENITYGVAQLASTIKFAATIGDSEFLTDNADVVTNHEVADNVFDGSGTPAKTITLKVHGMLIGNQPNAARYDYLPQSTTTNKIIYDRFSVDGKTVGKTGEGIVENYTLALDNYDSDAAEAENEQPTVKIALEMTADKDFYGVSGMIKAGQKFYLIGALNPNTFPAASKVDWTKHNSFDSEENGYGTDRVFIRDAKTVANFTLGKNCLKNAYSTIPDLRSTQMLFGISVDLVWKTGLTFEVPIGN